MTQPEPFFTADFGPGGKFEWGSQQELTSWISSLQNNWSWINKPRIKLNQAWSKINQAVGNLQAHLQAAQQSRNQGNTASANASISQAQTAIQGLISNSPWLLTNSARKSFLDDLRQNGEENQAAVIATYWMNQGLEGVELQLLVSAIVRAELFERAGENRVQHESNALKHLAGELQSELVGYKESLRAQENHFEDLHNKHQVEAEQQQSRFDADQEVRNESWGKQLAQTQTELHNLKATYDQHMALAAPVSYWETKRRKHEIWSYVSFGVTFLCMALLGLVLHFEFKSIGDQHAEALTAKAEVQQSTANGTWAAKTDANKIGNAEQVKTANSATVEKSSRVNEPIVSNQAPITSAVLASTSTWKLASLILLATLSFWFIRLMVRIFLSNLHLENDAGERVTMAKTYLAMVRDGALNKDNNITTILAALFRPTGDGIVKDEGLPPTAREWFTKLGGK